MELPEGLRAKLLAEIREKFASEDVQEIELTSVEVDKEKREIHITVAITSAPKPQSVANGYFGLTGRVRNALGNEWSDFFPIITPQVANEAHA